MFWKVLRSIIKFIFRVIGKLLLLAIWCACEFLAAVFTALAKYFRQVITNSRNTPNAR